MCVVLNVMPEVTCTCMYNVGIIMYAWYMCTISCLVGFVIVIP